MQYKFLGANERGFQSPEFGGAEGKGGREGRELSLEELARRLWYRRPDGRRLWRLCEGGAWVTHNAGCFAVEVASVGFNSKTTSVHSPIKRIRTSHRLFPTTFRLGPQRELNPFLIYMLMAGWIICTTLFILWFTKVSLFQMPPNQTLCNPVYQILSLTPNIKGLI